jgi:glycosyltransferase involved in cell wall biosynthesis
MRSVLDQKYGGLEYIVIDGASTDESCSVIQTHEKALSYWLSEPDNGQTEALIKGFARCTGEVQGWLCSDDLLLPGALGQIGNFFASHPDVDAVYGDALWIDAEGNFLRPKKEGRFFRHAFMFDHNFIPQPSMFWRRRLYEKVGGLDTRFNLAMDADLWERFSRHTKIGHISSYLSCMRYYPEQKTRALRPQGRREDLEIRSRSKLSAWPAPVQPFNRLAGKVLRLTAKFVAGGYGASAPPDVDANLKPYKIGQL